MSGPTRQTILIANIRRDGGTQPRAELVEDAVQEYAELMKDGATFPPVEVYYDGTEYWLSGGFHRCAAHELLGWPDIEAEVKQGTKRDAQWASLAANKEHGLRRTAADVRRSLYRIFHDPEWKDRSTRDIASHTGISKGRINDLFKEFREQTGQEGPSATGVAPHNKGKSANDAFPEPAGSRRTQANTTTNEDSARARADEDDGTHSTAEGSTTPEPGQNSQSSDGACPWEAFNAEIREKVIGNLRTAYKELSRITDYDTATKRMMGRFAQGFSAAGTLGPISAIAKAIEKALPAEPSDEHPGYLTGARVDLLDARTRTRKSA